MCLTVLCSSRLFHQQFPARRHQNTELLETLRTSHHCGNCHFISCLRQEGSEKTIHILSSLPRKNVPFQEISHFNSIKFLERFYTACKAKTMSLPHNHLTQHPRIENTTLSLKHNYTLTFLANSFVKTLIFLEWKHKPQRERDGETETEERNKDQLHKPFSRFIPSRAAEAARPLRHLDGRVLFLFFLKNIKSPGVALRNKLIKQLQQSLFRIWSEFPMAIRCQVGDMQREEK